MNFIPHIVLFIFTMDGSDLIMNMIVVLMEIFSSVLNSAVSAIEDLRGEDDMTNTSEERSDMSWIENAHLVMPTKGMIAT